MKLNASVVNYYYMKLNSIQYIEFAIYVLITVDGCAGYICAEGSSSPTQRALYYGPLLSQRHWCSYEVFRGTLLRA